MSNPVAVILGDVHFTPSTLELATQAVKQALAKAIELNVPLILNGDTLDSKAIMRAECVNRLIELLDESPVPIIINTGNHDLVNEKAKESSLNFLTPYALVISEPLFIHEIKSWVIPYQSSSEAMQDILNRLPAGERLIIHQGVQTAYLGHYAQDKTSLPPEAYENFRVIASHYHRRQDIKCGRPRKGAVGLFSYLGNPYTLSFGETQDGPKGFSVLMDDGLLEFVELKLRKHVVIELTTQEWAAGGLYCVDSNSHLWIKITGPKSELETLKKSDFEKVFKVHNFKLDLIPTDGPTHSINVENTPVEQVFDSLIDQLSETTQYKEYLKSLWREIN